VPYKQPKRRRLWLNDGSCIRLSPRYRNHAWSWDFVFDRTRDGRTLKLMVEHGVPEHIRSDNGPEMGAEELRDWLEHMGTKTACIEPGSPWENDYCESFNGRLRDELLNGEIFYTLKEAQVVIGDWRNHYNIRRPHSAPGYRPPAPEVVMPGTRKGSTETGQMTA